MRTSFSLSFELPTMLLSHISRRYMPPALAAGHTDFDCQTPASTTLAQTTSRLAPCHRNGRQMQMKN